MNDNKNIALLVSRIDEKTSFYEDLINKKKSELIDVNNVINNMNNLTSKYILDNILEIIPFCNYYLKDYPVNDIEKLCELRNGSSNGDCLLIAQNVLDSIKDQLLRKKQDINNKILFYKNEILRLNEAASYLEVGKDGLLVSPIDTQRKFDLLVLVMKTCDFGYQYVTPILMEFLNINSKSLQSKEQKNIKRQHRKVKNNKTLYFVLTDNGEIKSKFTSKQLALLDRIKKINEENKKLIEVGLVDDCKYIWEDFKNSKSVDILTIDESNETNLQIIIYVLSQLYNMGQENFDDDLEKTIESVLSVYDNVKKEYQKDQEMKQQLVNIDLENKELLDNIKIELANYNHELSNMTSVEKEVFISIKTSVSSLFTEDFDDKESTIDELIAKCVNSINVGAPKITVEFYNYLNDLEELLMIYEAYKEETDVNQKKSYLRELENCYEAIVVKRSLEKDLINVDITSDKNKLLYLLFDDNSSCLGKRLNKEIISQVDSKYISRLINDLKTLDVSTNALLSKKVKNSFDGEILRRKRANNVRIIYVDLTKLCKINYHLDKPCYVVVATGVKHGSKEIYDYVTSLAVNNALFNLKNQINQKQMEIEKSSMNEEEKTRIFNNFINELINYSESVVFAECPIYTQIDTDALSLGGC